MANDWTQACQDADYAIHTLDETADAITAASIDCPLIVQGEIARIKAAMERIELAIKRVERRAAA